MIPSQPLPKGEYRRALAANLPLRLGEVLRDLTEVDQVDQEQLVELTALARLVLDETRRLFAAAARHRGVRWLGEIDLQIAAATRRARLAAAAADVSLEALARGLPTGEERAA